MDHPAILVLGNPENRRVSLFQAALAQMGRGPARVVSYLDLLQKKVSLEDLITPETCLRIESPGENFEVEKHLLKLGGIEHAHRLPEERGQILYPKAWFAGFGRLMESQANLHPTQWFNHPCDILTMFDKPRCKQLLPDCLAPLPWFDSFDAFFEFAKAQNRPRFFIKLNYSSSASGILAWEYHRKRGTMRAYTTVELVQGPKGVRCYNSLKIKHLTSIADIRAVADFLFQSGAFVEPWIPKAIHEGYGYDLRVLAIAGKRHHCIARLSHSPMTNLHLGNRRCDPSRLDLDAFQWQQIDAIIARTMACFPRSLYAGLDILLPLSGGAPTLLEANAFGDLIPNLKHQGLCTYSAQLQALSSQAMHHA